MERTKLRIIVYRRQESSVCLMEYLYGENPGFDEAGKEILVSAERVVSNSAELLALEGDVSRACREKGIFISNLD